MRPWVAGAAPDWRTRGVQAEIGGQLAPILEAADVADGGHERRGDDDVDSGDGHQPLDLRPAQRLRRDELLDRGDLSVEEIDLAQTRVDRLALGERQLLLAQPSAALDAEEVGGGRAVLEAAHQPRVDLVLRARPGADQLRTPRQAPAHHADALIRRPDPVKLASPQQLGQGSGVEAVGVRPSLADSGIARRDDDHARDMLLEDPRDLPCVAGHLQRDPVARIEALRKQLKRLRPRRDATPGTQLAVGDDRDLAEIAVHIQRDCSHPILPAVVDTRRTGGQTTSTDPRSQRNRASRRGGH